MYQTENKKKVQKTVNSTLKEKDSKSSVYTLHYKNTITEDLALAISSLANHEKLQVKPNQ